jgi:hypothetical protein
MKDVSPKPCTRVSWGTAADSKVPKARNCPEGRSDALSLRGTTSSTEVLIFPLDCATFLAMRSCLCNAGFLTVVRMKRSQHGAGNKGRIVQVISRF